MSQKIKRNAKSARKTASTQGKSRKVKQAKAKTGSALDAVMTRVPLSEDQLHKVFLFIFLACAVALVWFFARLAGLPELVERQVASVASNTGFEVRRVDVRGVKNMNELKVYERVLAEQDRAMPLVDLDALREKLLELPWIEDARVSRQLPDTLVIDIVERKPHAVLRKADRFVLVDNKGNELEPVSAQRAHGMLVVSGPGSKQQVASLSQLLNAAPALKPQVREAEWIGNRRWNLTFKTDQVLALPEGEKLAASALVAFARLDGTNRLLGGKVVAFDMRAGDRIYLRIPGRARQEAALDAGATRKTGED